MANQLEDLGAEKQNRIIQFFMVFEYAQTHTLWMNWLKLIYALCEINWSQVGRLCQSW